MASPEDVCNLTEKCREKAEKWKSVADVLWAKSRGCVERSAQEEA
jgi:hypothetical protein